MHRADGSGTTSNFTKYLADAAGSDWTLGSGDTVDWPSSSQAGQGNAGVAQIDHAAPTVRSATSTSPTPTQAKLKFASIENKAGKFVAPTLAGASAAVAAPTINDDLTYNPLNAAGADAYPITSPTWIIVYAKQTDKAKGTALKSFLHVRLQRGSGRSPRA